MHRLKKIANRSLQNAGARYTPRVDSHAPNLKITYLVDSMNCLIRGKFLCDSFNEFLTAISKRLTSDESYLKKCVKSKKYNIQSIIKSIRKYLVLKPDQKFDDLFLLKKSVDYVYKRLEEKRSNLWLEKDKAEGDRVNKINGEIYLLNKWVEALSNLNEITNAKYFELSNNPYLLIGGVAGTGKTHLLCDFALKNLNESSPVLMILAQDISKVTDPLSEIAKYTEFAKNKTSLLRKLSRLAKKKNERALIIIDGINEGDYQGWKNCFSLLISDLKKFPEIGLIISARAPLDKIFCDEEFNNKILILNHFGFDGIEFDAITEFFHYYGIPMPDYPLLDSEFSNPLFLKIACEFLKDISQNKRNREINEIASGLKTITALFEDYVVHCSKKIAIKYKLNQRICWEIIKGKNLAKHGINDQIGIAVTMAKEGREWIYPEEFVDIIKKHTNLLDNNIDQFCAEFLLLGIVTSDIRWNDKKKIIKLPYQRISDHIIARSLLNGLKKIKDEAALKKELEEDTKLGCVFQINDFGWRQYAKPELAAAIIMEFPEYVKHKKFISEDRREIVNFLPSKNQSVTAFYEPFLLGLYWRNNSNFNKCTNYLVQYFLEYEHDIVSRKALEVISNLATRKNHVYNGKRLFKYLSKFNSPDRDFFWSEFLRLSENNSVRGRLIRWLGSSKIKNLDKKSVNNFIYVLKLFLYTTDDLLRDKSTKLIFDLGLQYLSLIFSHTINAFKLRDLYFLERLLAASYGVAMRCAANNKHVKTMTNFAKAIYILIFDHNAKYITTHFIIRDYASNLILLANSMEKNMFTNQQISRSTAPFNKMGIKLWMKSQKQTDAWPLSFDFRENKIATLAGNHNRHNFQSPAQIEVEAKLLWRMKKLGLDERFKSIDEIILRSQPFRGKKHVKSYGEKYALIAYYELIGFLYDRGMLLDRFCGSQTRVEVDIDPSFPEYTNNPNFVPGNFIRKSKNISEWVKHSSVPNIEKFFVQNGLDNISGKAVLLSGNIFREDKKIQKRISTIFRGFFIQNDLKDECISTLNMLHLDNLRIPEAPIYRYMYAGEIPWSATFNTQNQYSQNLFASVDSISINPDGYKIYESHPVLDVDVELPDAEYSWSTDSCQENRIGSIPILSKKIIDHFKFRFDPDGMNFYDKSNKQVTSVIKHRDSFYNNHEFLYISERFLKQYLEDNKYSLFWIIWGERAKAFEDINDIHKDKSECIWKRYKKIKSY